MGTVGLSFGSPTSGTGFDVSSTVATIIGNLRNVETPWKSQLTQLQSQDTAISSIGTLLSNLSNDVSALTNLTGIMAQKTGSSSNNNVLQLSSATSAAIAGSHTVVVGNLAQISSGYLASVANSSDTLSGSITLQAGNGQARTIDMETLTDQTLDGLAAAINSSGAGISANVLTDSSGSWLSLTSGTSGAGGNIAISDNSLAAATADAPSSPAYTAAADNLSGTLDKIADQGDTLSGSISIQAGNGTAQAFDIDTLTDKTVSGLANAINAASMGVTASVLTNNDGTVSLSLQSDSSAALTVSSSVVDSGTAALGYTSAVTGKDAVLTVDGKAGLTSPSNTVSGLIPGLTFQLLSASTTDSSGDKIGVQVVIGNDNADVESTVAIMVNDYNSLISAMNAQQGNDSSGNPQPLFGSPTLSLLQQQIYSGITTQNPNGYMDSIAADTGTTLSGSITIAVGGGKTQTIVIGSAVEPPPADTFYTGSGSGSNTLQGVADAINAAAAGTSMSYTGVAGTDTVASSGTLTAIPDASLPLSGTISIQVGGGAKEKIVIGDAPSTGAAANTIYTGDGVLTLAELAGVINAAGIGVTAAVTTPPGGVSTMSLTSGTLGADGTLSVTSALAAAGIGVSANVVTQNGQERLSLLSQTAGSTGALAVKSAITATSNAPLRYSGTAGSSTTPSQGSLTAIADKTDTLSGSISIQVGGGTAQTVNIDPAHATLSGLADTINKANIGVTAVVDSDGTTLSFLSGTSGSAGTLTVTSSILDTTDTYSTPLNYTNSSNVSGLANLGITTSTNYDGTLTFDASVLDAALNTDFAGVLGFFQNVNSWGQNFSTMLNNAGSTSSFGMLKLATKSNSSMESTLNANISREESMISVQQKSLTAELNSANEIMQSLPSQLDGINMLYSAITGYNKNG